MKNWFSKLTVGALSLLAVTACEKDETRVVAQADAAPKLTTSGNNLTLLQDKAADKAVTYTWTPTTFGFNSVVTYTLQFDKKGGDFSAPSSFSVGSALSRTLTVSELNSIYVGKGLVNTTTTPAQLDARVVASIGPKSADVISTVSTITATPYNFCDQPAPSKAWALIGPAGKDWGTDIAMTYDCATKTYTYTGPLNADKFKFRYGGSAPADGIKPWDINLGGTASTGGELTQGGPDLAITKAGTYTITLSPTIGADNKAAGSFTIK